MRLIGLHTESERERTRNDDDDDDYVHNTFSVVVHSMASRLLSGGTKSINDRCKCVQCERMGTSIKHGPSVASKVANLC